MRAVCPSLPPSICLAGLSHPLSSSVSSGSVSQYQERSRSLKEMLMFCPPLWVQSWKEDDSAAASVFMCFSGKQMRTRAPVSIEKKQE